MDKYVKVETVTQLLGLITEPGLIKHHVFQNIDFSEWGALCTESDFKDCLFLGCRLPEQLLEHLDASNLIFPKLNVPYDIYRSYPYSAKSLYEGYDPNNEQTFSECFDSKVFQHYKKTGSMCDDVKETLARYLHDHSMSNAIQNLLAPYHERQIVGIMGGHDLLRTTDYYRNIVYLSKRLTEMGFIMVSGGGAGAMEATHLGAWMAERSQEEVQQALEIVARAPSWQDKDWLATAYEVKKRFPQTHFISLGVPTWLYGHEPSTPLATHIAKFFDNSIREDTILNITRGGLVFTPGWAGTIQEIFQAAVPNLYKTYGYSSLMIFMGEDFWRRELPVYALLEHLVKSGQYAGLRIGISDDINEVIHKIKTFKPITGEKAASLGQ